MSGDMRRQKFTLKASSWLPRQSAPGAAGDVPDRDHVFGDLIEDPVPAYPQPPEVGRPVREGPGWAGSSASRSIASRTARMPCRSSRNAAAWSIARSS
jgi:hypothetical protein